MNEKAKAVLDGILDKAKHLESLVTNEHVKDKEVASDLKELRRLVVKAQATSGMTLNARCRDKALDKLTELEFWLKKDTPMVQRKIIECVGWVEAGLSD